jgi:hypothetical protein
VPYSEYRASFDPKTLEILQSAFDSASQELLATGVVLVSDATRESVRATLAKRIVAAAQQGERDPAALTLAALRGEPVKPPTPTQ